MQSQQTTALSPGALIAGRYRVERLLGTGGMGRVFAARHIELDELVAIKVVLPQLEGDTTYVNRLLREGRNAVKIRSEHVARILDVGRNGEGGTPFVVMEYLDGQDLAQVLRARGPLPIGDACEHMLQACEAVASAHALGIVHRDLKPANLFLTRRADGSPCIKVLDFGICKVLSQAGMALTGNSALLGSPNYVSPEQIVASSQVDGAADVWSLGVLLFRLLTNRLPFEGSGSFDVMGKILRAAPIPLRAVDASLPVDLERTILRCLEKDRTVRLGLAELAFAMANHAPSQSRLLAERIARLLPPKGGAEALVTTRVPGHLGGDADEDDLVAKVWDSLPPAAAQTPAAAGASWLQAPIVPALPRPPSLGPFAPLPTPTERPAAPLTHSERPPKGTPAGGLERVRNRAFDGAPTHHGPLVVNNAAPASARSNSQPTFASPTSGGARSVHPPHPSVAPVTSAVLPSGSTPSTRPAPNSGPTLQSGPTSSHKSSRPGLRPQGRSVAFTVLALVVAALVGVAGALVWRTMRFGGLHPAPAQSNVAPTPRELEAAPSEGSQPRRENDDLDVAASATVRHGLAAAEAADAGSANTGDAHPSPDAD